MPLLRGIVMVKTSSCRFWVGLVGNLEVTSRQLVLYWILLRSMIRNGHLNAYDLPTYTFFTRFHTGPYSTGLMYFCTYTFVGIWRAGRASSAWLVGPNNNNKKPRSTRSYH